MRDFIVALGLVLAIEGALYAAAPAAMKRMLRAALDTPEQALRTAGLALLAMGVAVVWLVRG